MKVFRLMKQDPDGGPTVGIGSMMLGVRPKDPAQLHKRFDVLAIDPADAIAPGGGGLSVYAETSAIRISAKKLFLWSIESDALEPQFSLTASGPPHYLIGPSLQMALGEFQILLAATRQSWQLEMQETD